MNFEYSIVAEATSRVPVPAPFASKLTISGKALAHSKLTALQAAALAAQIKMGERQLVNHTVEQIAGVTRAQQATVSRAMRMTPQQRQAMADGTMKKMPPMAPVSKKNKQQLELPLTTTSQDLLNIWNAATPAERVKFARAIGVERAWPRSIAR